MPEESTPSPETLAEAIVRIAGGLQKLSASGLNRRAIVCLIYDSTTNVAKREIEAVLNSLENLKRNFCR